MAPKRPLLLSVLIILLALGTLNALRILFFQRDFFIAQFPGSTPLIIAAYATTAVAILLGLFGLWRLDRWSVPLLLLATVATLVLDFLASAPTGHKVATVMSLFAMAACSRPVWSKLFG